MKVPNLLPLYADQAGAQAAARLFAMCMRHQGGGTEPLAEFLISLYNSTYSRPNMYLLCRRVDDNHFEDVISVMTWFRDVAGLIDIHTIFGDDEGELVMRELMERFGLSPEVIGI